MNLNLATSNDINIEAVEQYICRVKALTVMIRKSQERAKVIATSTYYGVFGNEREKSADLEKQNAVTKRISGYLLNTIRKEMGHEK